MSCLAIYDDRVPMTDAGREFIGISRYSQLLFRRRTLQEHMLRLLRESGFEEIRIISRDRDLEPLLRAQDAGIMAERIAYLPSCMVSTDQERSRLFLAKSRYVDEGFHIHDDGPDQPGLIVAQGENAGAALRHLAGRNRGQSGELWLNDYRAVDSKTAALSSLHRYERLVEFISANFDVRHFNSIRQDGYVVTKRSSDRDKMRREYRLFDLLPERLRMYFLPPFSYAEEDGHASYQMERLCIPDMGIQWVHGVIEPAEFAVFLDRIGTFLLLRPRQESSREAARELYIGKCERRLAQLEAHPGYPRIAEAFVLARCDATTPRDLLGRYRRLWERLAGRRRRWYTALSHGDLCFSNILYGRQTRLLKLIDPRGADNTEDAYLDEYYDLAKLSHSILGRYDFINHDLVEMNVSPQLALRLEYPGICDRQQEMADTFVTAIQEAGYDPLQVRLAEAALFLSMLPLHIDAPRKVVAFALTAARIIDQLEEA